MGAAGCLFGCADRVINITSAPPGAIVELNGVEVGRTPLETQFTYFGHYDVRLRLDGYEPISQGKLARAPLYEVPPLDLAAEASPLPVRTRLQWHFELQPADADPDRVLERAKEFRDRTTPSS